VLVDQFFYVVILPISITQSTDTSGNEENARVCSATWKFMRHAVVLNTAAAAAEGQGAWLRLLS
jgi:hypothetical protein